MVEPGQVELRAVVPADRPFLRAVYGSTRWEELEPTGWSDPEKETFLDQQFAAQEVHYASNYENAAYCVVVVGGFPAGRLYVARWEDEIRIIDIALLPTARGKGVGTSLLHAVIDEAAAAGKRVSIHVERENPALQLYERLGFARADEWGPYYLMELSAPS